MLWENNSLLTFDMGLLGKLKDLFSRSGDTASGSNSQGAVLFRDGTYGSLLCGGESSALALATVYRCVRLLSDSVANLPIRYMRLCGGVFEEDTTSPLHYLLTVQPNANMSAFDFWAQVVSNMLLDGDAYIIPIYNGMTPHSLILCQRGTVSHDVYNDTYTVADEVNGISGTYKENEVIHIKGGVSRDGKRGVSVLTHARLALAIGGSGDEETLNRFKNGGTVRGLIGNDKTRAYVNEYRDSELASAAADIDSSFQSGARIVSLPGQVDFKQISLSSTDMQFLESRKFTVREICRFFGVHPSFVFDDTSNNYKSAEMANVAFLSSTLNPILRKIENELHRKLIITPSLCCKRKFLFDRRGLYACDLDSKVKYQLQTIQAGLYTVNEWRKEENKLPVEGGDKILVSANLKSIDEPANQVAAGGGQSEKEL